MKKLLPSGALLLIFVLTTLNLSGQYTGTFEDVALLKVASAVDSIAGFEPSKTVDGSLDTYCSIGEDAPTWLQIDLGTYYNIDGFSIMLPLPAELPRTFIFQVSENGTTWYDRGSGNIDTDGEYGYTIPILGPIRYVRLMITLKDDLASISQFQVFGEEIVIPSFPPTALPATDITSSGFTAHWSKRQPVAGYTLSVASDVAFSNPVPGYVDLDVGDVLKWPVTGLDPNMTYYYKVKAYNIVGSTGYSNTAAVTTLKYQEITFDPLNEKNYGDSPFDLVASASSGLTVTFTSSNEDVATIAGSTVTLLAAGTVTIIASQEGDLGYDAALPVEQELVVNPVILTITGATAEDKEYDGTDVATISGAVLEGVLGTDDVVLTNDTSAVFVQPESGTDLEVIAMLEIDGDDAANYLLEQPSGITATITPKELIVEGASAQDKVYDGTMEAVISGAGVEGVISGDDVTIVDSELGQFAQASIGTGIVVTSSMSLGGADAGNYILTLPEGLTASITPRELTVTAEDMVKLSCEEIGEYIITYEGFADSEDQTVLDTQPTASSEATGESPGGDYPITVSGGVSANYQFIYVDGTLTISEDDIPPVLTVKDITIQLDEGGEASISAADLIEVVEDNCGIADTTLSQSIFTGNDVGEVNVLVTALDAAGNSTTELAKVTVQAYVGIDNMTDWNSLVYPNPTEGRVEMILPVEVDHVMVMDMTGKTIISRSNLRSSETFDLSEFSNGIYIFQLHVGDATQHVKVIKK